MTGIIDLIQLEKITENLYNPTNTNSTNSTNTTNTNNTTNTTNNIDFLAYSNKIIESYTSLLSANNNIDIPINELFNFLIQSNNQHCLFYILDLLVKLVNTNYTNLNTTNTSNIFKLKLLQLFHSHIRKLASLNFITNKYCLLVITYMKYDFPDTSPDYLKEFMHKITEENDSSNKILKIELYVNMLNIFDEEMVKFRHTYTSYESTKTTLIKDTLRINNHVVDSISLINLVLKNYSTINSDRLVYNCLKVLSQLIDWNALNFFEESISICINSLIKYNKYINKCLNVINSLVSKGMTLVEKVMLLDYINYVKIIGGVLSMGIGIGNSTNNTSNFDILDSLFVLSDIIQNLGIYLSESLLMVDISNTTNPEEKKIIEKSYLYLIETLDFSFIILRLCYRNDELKIAQNIVEFYVSFNTLLKHNNSFISIFEKSILNLIDLLHEVLVIPTSLNITYDFVYRKNEELKNFRKEFLVIYQNLYHMIKESNSGYGSMGNHNNNKGNSSNNPNTNTINISNNPPNKFMKEAILNYLITKLEGIKNKALNNTNNTNTTNINNKNTTNISNSDNIQIEHILFLLTNLDNTGTYIANTNLDEHIKILIIKYLFEIDFTNTSLVSTSETVLLLYYECLVKYLPCYINNLQYLEHVSRLFISPNKGICYSVIKIGGKISLTLLKFVEKIRINLNYQNSAASNIGILLIQSIQNILVQILNTKNIRVLIDFASLYQSFGILVNNCTHKLTEDSKLECFKEIFNAFYNAFEIFGIDSDKFTHVSKLILNFFKSFNSEIKSNKEPFVSFLEVLYTKIYLRLEKSDANTLLFISILQKYLIIISKDALNFLDFFFKNEGLNSCSIEVFENLIKLLINTIMILKNSSKDLIVSVFPSFYMVVKQMTLPICNISEQDKNILNLYGYLIKLINNITLDFVDVFFEIENSNSSTSINNTSNKSLQELQIIDFLISICSNIIDAPTRRMAYKSLKGIVLYLVKFTNNNSNSNSNINNEISKVLNLTFYLKKHKISENDPTDMNVSMVFIY